jgi:hypothetical protein
LPASLTWHATDWQQQLPQLDWQVISAAYQEAHPGLTDLWGPLFLQLGAVSVPPLVPRVVNKVELLRRQQQQQLQQVGSGDSTSMPGTLGLTDTAAAPAAAAAAGIADDRRQQQQSAPTSNADAAAVAGVTMSDAIAMDVDVDTNKQQLTTPPPAAAGVAAAAVRTARRVRFEAADVQLDEHDNSNSSSGAVVDWWCPDLEALLSSMPAMQHTSSSSSSSEASQVDVVLQHAALCR